MLSQIYYVTQPDGRVVGFSSAHCLRSSCRILATTTVKIEKKMRLFNVLTGTYVVHVNVNMSHVIGNNVSTSN